jgi:hypothetical protein
MSAATDPLILDRGTHVGPSLIRGYLDAHPSLAVALAAAGARIVTFEPAFAADDLFAALRDALDAAARSVPRDTSPLLVAVVGLTDLIAACDGRGSAGTQLTVPAIACPRGAFLGYIALGEGGVVFYGADGRRGPPTPEEVLALLGSAPRGSPPRGD